jgi:hypothetical protein
MGAVGRNDPCPCGSGKKYKKCCLGSGMTPSADGLTIGLGPLKEIWSFGEVKVVRGSKTNDFFRDLSVSEDRVRDLLAQLYGQIAQAKWTFVRAEHIYFDYDSSLLGALEELDNRVYDPGSGGLSRAVADSLGINKLIEFEAQGVRITRFLVLNAAMLRECAEKGMGIVAIHTLCHEFAHAFGVNWQGRTLEPECKRNVEGLADYFSLSAIMARGGFPGVPDLHRWVHYLSSDFMERNGRRASSNEELREFAGLLLTEAGVMPFPGESQEHG